MSISFTEPCGAFFAFAEVIEYARWLGMNPENEESLLWIAREGIKVSQNNLSPSCLYFQALLLQNYLFLDTSLKAQPAEPSRCMYNDALSLIPFGFCKP
jgi:hypothetical protein